MKINKINNENNENLVSKGIRSASLVTTTKYGLQGCMHDLGHENSHRKG